MNLFNDFLNTISDTEVTTTSAIFKLMLSLLLGILFLHEPASRIRFRRRLYPAIPELLRPDGILDQTFAGELPQGDGHAISAALLLDSLCGLYQRSHGGSNPVYP